jgi:hypothetical protein
MTFKNIFDDLFDEPDDRDLSLREQIQQARPGRQIEVLRPHVEKFWRPGGNHLLDCLLEAEGLLSRLLEGSGDEGARCRAEFDGAIERIIAEIEKAELKPLAERGARFSPGGIPGRQTRAVKDRHDLMRDTMRILKKRTTAGPPPPNSGPSCGIAPNFAA